MKIKRLLVIISVMGLSLGFIVANFLFANNNANTLITITASKKINLQSSDQLKCPVDKYTRKINNDGINRIHYISVGGGDATLIESNGHYGLVDSANPTYKDGTAQAIIKDPKNTVDHVIEYLKKVIGYSRDTFSF